MSASDKMDGDRGESCQRRLDEMKRGPEPFPLSEEASAELHRVLQGRILDIYDGEMAAHAALGAIVCRLQGARFPRRVARRAGDACCGVDPMVARRG